VPPHRYPDNLFTRDNPVQWSNRINYLQGDDFTCIQRVQFPDVDKHSDRLENPGFRNSSAQKIGIEKTSLSDQHAAAMSRGENFRRVRLVGAFALLLALCVAAPVLAADEPEEVPLPPAAPAEVQPEPPTQAELEAEEAQRENSEYAYVDLTPAEEEALLRERFATELEAIDADPARSLTDVVLNKVLSPTDALVTLEGRKLLLESQVPLRVPEEGGDLRKVDLGLEATPSGFEPANPLVELDLPEHGGDPIGIGEEGLAITPVGAGEVPASPLGEEDLFLPAVHEDTSLLLSPIAGGVELSAMLASRNSPQQLAFDVDLPPGAQLRTGESGGAEAVDAEGGLLAAISPPRAVDAQGTQVPATLAVEGGKLALAVPHRDLDLAYPIFVDPEIVEDWSGFADTSKLGYWNWQYSGVGPEDFIGRRSCIVTPCWGNGLYLRARSNTTYPAGSWARWWFQTQGQTTYMHKAVLGPINYATNGCMGNEPHPYVGIWNDASGWVVLANAYPSGWGSYVDTGARALGPGSRTAFVGIHAAATVNLACGRDYRLGGAQLFLDDPENPTALVANGYPTGWVKKGQAFTVNGPASDPGLGLKRAHLSLGGSAVLHQELGCDGHYYSACPGSHTFQFPVGAESLDEGEKEYRFSVEDVLGKSSNTHPWMMKVDRSPPEIDLAGQLAQATDETAGDGEDDKNKPLPLPVYNLTINATDGEVPAAGTSVPLAKKRSGVKKIQIFLDAGTTPLQSWEASSCAAGNCPLSKTFTLKLNEISATTEHYLRILATDFAGNEPRERKIEFEYIPATGIKDEYVMQYFPLPDGSGGNEDEEERPSRPELAVNLVSGNLVYRQQDAEVTAPGADLELDLYYNSLLPEQQNTEWGDGWTLEQTPELEIEAPPLDPSNQGGTAPPAEATIVEESGAVESKVDLPEASGEEVFDKRLQATVEKAPGGGYELTDESGETGNTVSFSSSGRAEELSNGTSATVDLEYEEGDLAGIAIEDPGTANVDPASLPEEDTAPDFVFAHSASFGGFGTADGQMKAPADVLADAQGNVWVLERDGGRIQKFGPEGQFLAKFGVPGTADGQFNAPTAFTFDAAGNLLVADSNRVQKLSPSGQFLAKFGTAGGGNGQFLTPVGITVGIDGSIWVADTYQSRVQRFTAAGQFIERVGSSVTGQFSQVHSLDTAPNGDVYVADMGADNIKVYDKNGDFVRQFGASGTGPGQLAAPTEVKVDAEGRVWVGDAQTDRVLLFDSAGEFVAEFGGSGAGAQQLGLEGHTGIAVGRGRVWIGDTANHRLARWTSSSIRDFLPTLSFGGFGSEDGQLKKPGDLLTDPQGNVWILDRNNGRVQKFDSDGQFLAKWGTLGSAEGQLNYPAAFARDGAGNILVAETNRVQKFSPGGQLLAKFATVGGTTGSYFTPAKGIAVGVDGTIWVCEAANGRVLRFAADGQFIERVGASGAGQTIAPQGLDAAANGDVYVADGDRIKVFDKNGDFVRQFGATGTGPGQLSKATEVEVDAEGKVWIADEQTDRVQLYSAAGDYLAAFGSLGSGAQQVDLDEFTGLAADGATVLLADGGNNRVGEWIGGINEPSSEPVLTEDDPQLEVEVSEGLVDTVEGEEAGTIDYEHTGDLLTSVSAPKGEAQFAYDSAGRMTKVTLPGGTYGSIAYEATYGRVKSVTVSIKGATPKTTYFNYSDNPRSTTVVPPDAAATTYDIAADGSIFKWRNAKQPPVFDYLAGTLYDPNNRETATPIAVGVHTLSVQAHDSEGIASIQVIANGGQLVDEKNCEADPSEPSKCATLVSEWVTETGNWPPGIVYLEVIATDRLGEAVSQRFWVNIPYTPPADPEAEESPRFSEILRFREEFGLDLDLKGDEFAINDRIFELMGDWHNPNTPAGEIARVTANRWGIPLRAVDAAELEFRQQYVKEAASVVPGWATQNAPSTYAGYYVDHRAGGVIRVGFTADQTANVAALKQAGVLTAPERIEPFPSAPRHRYKDLLDAQTKIGDYRAELPSLTRISIDDAKNIVMAGTTGSAQDMAVALRNRLGVDAPVETFFDTEPPAGNTRKSRDRLTGRIRAGDRIRSFQLFPGWCTAGFGAWSKASTLRGQSLFKHYLLIAAHCGALGHLIYRGKVWDPDAKDQDLGRVRRSGIMDFPHVDGAAVLLEGEADQWTPRQIYRAPGELVDVTGVTTPDKGMIVCGSGVTTDRPEQGEVLGPPVEFSYTNPSVQGAPWVQETWEVPVDMQALGGDSGGPVWECGTGKAIGLWNAGTRPSYVTPLLPMATGSQYEGTLGPLAPGILAKLGFQPQNLSITP
jgi:tripartite motif-containing protein 71